MNRQTSLVCTVILLTLLQTSASTLHAQTPPAASPVLTPSPNAAPAGTDNPSINAGMSSGGACGNALPFPGATFDPYGTSNSSYNYSPYSPNYNPEYNYNTNPTQTDCKTTSNQQLLDAWNANILWLAGGSDGTKLGLTQVHVDATLAFPLCFDPKNALKITPGFNFNSWNSNLMMMRCGIPDNTPMADRTYDIYGDFAWTPQLNDWIAVDLAIRIGVYSDFHSVRGEALRLTGHAVGKFTVSQTWEAQLGIDYVNRVNIKLLPVVGVVWTNPEKTRRFECVFPYPKYTQKCTLIDSKTELWWYIRGEYGGGTWNVFTELPENYEQFDNVSYNDIRLAIGLDFEFASNVHGYFELGGAFNRKLEYQRTGEASLGDSFFLGGGLYY